MPFTPIFSPERVALPFTSNKSIWIPRQFFGAEFLGGTLMIEKADVKLLAFL